MQGGQQNQQPQPSPMDLIMMEKQADIQAEGQKGQLRLSSKQQENQLDFVHKQKLAQVDTETKIAQERIRVWGKQQDAAQSKTQQNGDAQHERALKHRQLDIDSYRAMTERAQAHRDAQQKASAAKEKTNGAAASPPTPDYMPAILDLVKHVTAKKQAVGVRRTKDGMRVIFEGEQ